MLKRLSLLILLAILALAIFSSTAKTTYTETVNHVVGAGETLWSIARHYNTNRDVREVVEEIRKLNNCTPILQIGQELEVPVWR